MITHAFLRLTTEDDLFDLITLLKRGVKVTIEPVVGTLHGPVAPCKLELAPVEREGVVINQLTGKCWMRPLDLEDFLRRYLVERRRFNMLILDPAADTEVIKAAWEILNHGADYPLRATWIAKLAKLLASHYGGAVEAQLPYGHPDWVDWVKEGIGHLTLWHKPSIHEITDIVSNGCVGLVRADAMKPWYRGGLDFQMPDKGTLTLKRGQMAFRDDYEAAGAASGLGRTWDAVRGNYRLMGLLVDGDVPHARRQEIRDEARKATILARGPQPKLVVTAHGAGRINEDPPQVDRVYVEKGEITETVAWLDHHWDALRVVTFTG
uniref:hypothetical protein n=1 Tax=Methylobacterium sp. B34 TaxID=95563 RepID=UPI0003484B0D|nr:hypothetical protein [Methylobacterium sp. B34]